MEENVKKRRLLSRIFGRTFGRTFRRMTGAKDLTIVELVRAFYIRGKWLILGIAVGYILYRFDKFIIIEKWFLNILKDAI